jgi:hypothetical protein
VAPVGIAGCTDILVIVPDDVDDVEDVEDVEDSPHAFRNTLKTPRNNIAQINLLFFTGVPLILNPPYTMPEPILFDSSTHPICPLHLDIPAIL